MAGAYRRLERPDAWSEEELVTSVLTFDADRSSPTPLYSM